MLTLIIQNKNQKLIILYGKLARTLDECLTELQLNSLLVVNWKSMTLIGI